MSSSPTPMRRGPQALSPLARVLLWDYPRGSLAYDVFCLFVLLLLVLVPAGFWGDPMVGWVR